MHTASLILIAAGLVVLGGLFAMSDAAVASVSPARAAELRRENVRGGRALAAIAADPPRYTNLLLLLRLICELTATTLVALVLINAIDTGWLAVLTTAVIMAVVSFVVVGVAPRTIGRQHAYTVGRLVAPLVHGLGRALGPFATLLIRIGNAVTPGEGFKEGPFATQIELREMVDLAEQRGVVEHDERDMIHSVLALGKAIAREVMVPRTDMLWAEADDTAGKALELALRSGFSRLPVIGETVDDVLGIVYLKDLVRRTQAEGSAIEVSTVMRPATYVPESKHVDDLLREMQAARTHIVIVVDEYGGTAGLVTIEDILEEIVGDIRDEYDVDRPEVQRLDENRIRVSARLPVEDLGELFNVELEAEDVETVAGLLAQALGRVPIPGAVATVGGLTLEAEGTTGRRNRIDAVLVTRQRHVDEPADEGRTSRTAGHGRHGDDQRADEKETADA